MALQRELNTLAITGDAERIMLVDAYGDDQVDWLIQARQSRREELAMQLSPVEEEIRQVSQFLGYVYAANKLCTEKASTKTFRKPSLSHPEYIPASVA